MRRLPVFAIFLLIAAGCSFTVRPQEKEAPEAPKVSLGMDILYLNKGEEIPGRLDKIEKDGTYVFTNLDGKTSKYPSEQVLRIEFQRKRAGDDKDLAAELNAPILNEALKKEVSVEKYPNAAYVTIYDSMTVEIGKDLSYAVTRRTIAKVLTRRGMGIANQYVDYLADSATTELLFGRTITPEGKLLHVSESAVEDGSRFGTYPQYDNARRLKWSLKEVKVDSYVDYSYRVTHKPANLLAPLYETMFLRSTQPIIHREITVKAAPEAEPVLSGFMIEGNDRINRIESATPQGKFIRISAENMPRIEPENMMPPWPDVLPWTAVSLKRTWSDTGAEYAQEISKILSGTEDAASLKAKELAAGQASELEKARAIYNYVAKEIGFLEIAPGDYGFMPHKPGEILAAGQANALDKAFLLHAMLDAAGIESSLLLAHKRSEGHLAGENACLRQMGTPLVHVSIGARGYYCLPTTQVIPFGYIPAGVQGSTALVAIESSKKLVELPLLPAAEEGVNTFSEIELYADGRIRVKRKEKPAGGSEVSWREWSKLRPEEITQKFESMVSSIHPNAKLLDYSPRDPKEYGDLNEHLVINYEYEIPDYALNAGGEILVFRIPEINYSASSIEKYERELPMFWGSRYSFDNSATIRLPEGFKVENLPEEVKSWEGENIPFMRYEASFAARDNTIIFHDRLERTGVSEPASSYDVFIKTIKASAGLAKKWLVVEKDDNNK